MVESSLSMHEALSLIPTPLKKKREREREREKRTRVQHMIFQLYDGTKLVENDVLLLEMTC
jgi:hypothetical protein